MVRRTTPEEDLDRLAENLLIAEGDFISDRDSFDLSLERYLMGREGLSKKNKDTIFKKLIKLKPTIRDERLFKKARGTDLARDRKETAKRVTGDRKEFIRVGAKNIDFAGLDVRESEIKAVSVAARREFQIAAKVKGKIVFSKRETVRIKGKSFVRHRNKLGQFSSVK